MNIPTGISKSAFRAALLVRKHSPTILFASGIAGTITSTVLACKATLTLSDELPEMKKSLEEVKNNYPEDSDHRGRHMAVAYSKNVARVAQLYGPSIVIGSLSISALTGSHVVLNRRNAGLTAGYAAVQKAYDEYRERVKEEVGDERERDLYHAARTEKVVLPESEDGKKTAIKVADPNSWSAYARFFDEASIYWEKNAELNRLYVQCQQNYANNLLHSRGHVFLNEVYDALGLERSTAGQVVGWVLNDEGDNYVDFGIFEAANSAFVNGYERSVLLDFNVDGPIFDKI